MNSYLVMALTFLSFTSAYSAEIDQFTPRNKKIADSLANINLKIDSYVQQAINDLNENSTECREDKLYKELKKYLNNHVFGEITDAIEADSLIEKIDLVPSETIYREWSMLDGLVLGLPGAESNPMATSPLINVNETYIGLDKIEHLFERGYVYFDDHYLDGDKIEDVLISGVLTEKVIFGGQRWGTGVFSYGDLAANFNGMRFWNDVLGKNRDILARDVGPYLRCENNKWIQNKKIDISNYIDDSFDESINCSHFSSEGALKKALHELEKLDIKSCPLKPEKLAFVKNKYGYYSRFIINPDGLGIAKSMSQWRKDVNNEKGWKKVPEEFQPLLPKHLKNLEYLSSNHYLREFRIENKSTVKRPNDLRNEYKYYSFTTLNFNKNYEDSKLLECWYIFMTGGDCKREIEAPLPTSYTKSGSLDLLEYSRQISRQAGLVESLNFLKQELNNRDPESKYFKERIIETTLDKTKVFPDSFETIPLEQREKIGVFLVLGIGGDNSDNAILIRKASEKIRELGFTSSMLEVDPNKGSNHNSSMLKEILKHKIPKLDKVIFVSASKGTADFIHYFLRFGDTLPEAERNKVKLMVSLSGVIRSSFVAEYLANAKMATALMVKSVLKLSARGDMLDGIESLAKNPWEGYDPQKIHNEFPNMKWISFPSMPESELAVTNLSLWSGFLRGPVHRWSNIASPGDGLVETAASILPPDTGIQEYIIPIIGPHAMALGSYRKGIRLAPQAQGDRYDKVNPEAGPEILSALFRALPVSLIE